MGSLQRRFPRAPHAWAEDAVSSAFVDAVAAPTSSFTTAWQRDPEGLRDLHRLIFVVAKRHLSQCYKRSMQRERSLSDERAADEPLDPSTPLQTAMTHEIFALAYSLVDQAARRFGGARAPALRAALLARLEGDTDTEAARAHGVPREYVNRAKRWLLAKLRRVTW